ncbi:MAG: nucleoside triphosphate pyrophosphohydrolase, partial [Clostridiales bacterium]|nr:nucleoside triphosphate pyrophosphohydrolase [Candidatus Equinaster intestinalis]
FEELVEIIRILRAPGGCPWDAQQTHKSIRNEFIEETYEAVDAIDRDNATDLCEELGDVLLQILLHSQIAKEEDGFSIDDVINGISKKMILRHPHVFGDVKVSGTEEVLNNWDAIKKVEKNQSSAADTLYSVPMSYPALMRATKVVKRAQKAGVKAPSNEEIAKKITDIANSISENVNAGDTKSVSANLGKIYFALASLAFGLKIDSEEMLGRETDGFIKEFDRREKSNESIENMLS